MTDPVKDFGPIKDWDSSGWEHIYKRFNEVIKNRHLQNITQAAKIGFDLGSGIGQSAYALSLLCPQLQEIHCVDDKNSLQPPFSDILGTLAQEHRVTMQQFVTQIASSVESKADVVMISSLQGQPFFHSQDLKNLANAVRPGGVIFEYNSDYDFSISQTPMSTYFTTAYESRWCNVWIRNEA